MKHTFKLLITALLLLSFCFAFVACQTGGAATTTTTSADHSKDIQVLASLLKTSRPTTSETELVYTYNTGDVYTSTYTVTSSGECEYRIEEPNEFDISNPSADPIKVTEGTMNSNAFMGSLSMSNFNPTKDNLSYFEITTAENGNKVYTTSVYDNYVALFFGKAVKLSNLSITYEINSANKIVGITMTFLSEAQATVVSTTTFTY